MVLANDEILIACFKCTKGYKLFKRGSEYKAVVKAMDLLRLQIENEYKQLTTLR